MIGPAPDAGAPTRKSTASRTTAGSFGKPFRGGPDPRPIPLQLHERGRDGFAYGLLAGSVVAFGYVAVPRFLAWLFPWW